MENIVFYICLRLQWVELNFLSPSSQTIVTQIQNGADDVVSVVKFFKETFHCYHKRQKFLLISVDTKKVLFEANRGGISEISCGDITSTFFC